jgi:hypothetical protein
MPLMELKEEKHLGDCVPSGRNWVFELHNIFLSLPFVAGILITFWGQKADGISTKGKWHWKMASFP